MIPPEIVQQVKQIDLVSLIGKHVDLKKRGRDYWACCPFHTEKTPSFHITPEKNVYYCMGCGQGGTAIDWMINFHGLKMTEAVKILASEMGIRFEEVKNTLAPRKFKKLIITREQKQDEKLAFVDNQKAAEALPARCLTSKELIEWFKSKNIKLSVVLKLAEQRKIGWWGCLTYFYPDNAVKTREQLVSSRFSRWAQGTAKECWLADCLGDCKGNVWMFEGETDLMRTLPFIPQNDQAISMPSASWMPTPEQCYMIGAFRKVNLCFDGDKAGGTASERIAALLKKHANKCQVLTTQMPDSKDCCKLNDEELQDLIDKRVAVE